MEKFNFVCTICNKTEQINNFVYKYKGEQTIYSHKNGDKIVCCDKDMEYVNNQVGDFSNFSIGKIGSMSLLDKQRFFKERNFTFKLSRNKNSRYKSKIK